MSFKFEAPWVKWSSQYSIISIQKNMEVLWDNTDLQPGAPLTNMD